MEHVGTYWNKINSLPSLKNYFISVFYISMTHMSFPISHLPVISYRNLTWYLPSFYPIPTYVHVCMAHRHTCAHTFTCEPSSSPNSKFYSLGLTHTSFQSYWEAYSKVRVTRLFTRLNGVCNRGHFRAVAI